jgi:hypothetical protein
MSAPERCSLTRRRVAVGALGEQLDALAADRDPGGDAAHEIARLARPLAAERARSRRPVRRRRQRRGDVWLSGLADGDHAIARTVRS